jgi:hypothetical protein
VRDGKLVRLWRHKFFPGVVVGWMDCALVGVGDEGSTLFERNQAFREGKEVPNYAGPLSGSFI